MQRFQPLIFVFFMTLIGLLSACAGEKPIDKAIVGTWVQETPFSITDRGLQSTTSDTILRLKKNGETFLSRNLHITGQGIPDTGISVSVELRGHWELVEGHIRQSPEKVLIVPRNSDEPSRQWAEQLQAQAEKSGPSVKAIISANKTQLILQDIDNGTTDVYKRK